jgi:Lrp/AsnC family transcriptional regulator for asnA, asnC and gidA
MDTIDELDVAILGELERDARQPISVLARQLNSPISTIRDRIQRMEHSGIIRGYTVVVDHEKLGFPIKAIVHFTRDQQTNLNDFVERLSEIPEITNVQFLTGDTDELLTVYVKSIDHLREILYQKLPQIPGVIRTTSVIVLFEVNPPHIQRTLKIQGS